MTKVGIYLNRNKSYSVETAKQCIEFLNACHIQVMVTEEQEELFHFTHVTPCPGNIFFTTPDCIITLGGDGTLLSVARKAAVAGVPICGINLGKLGFLTDGNVEDLETLLTMLCEGNYRIEERMMLSCTIASPDTEPLKFIGLNDVLIKNIGMRMIGIKATADGKLVDEFRADGVIVASPTGSTAYSLAAGGPVVMPGAEVMLINPICPHRLHDKTYVISPESKIALSIDKTDENAELCIDGQIGLRISHENVVTIERAKEKARLIRPENFAFFERLRHKLNCEI